MTPHLINDRATTPNKIMHKHHNTCNIDINDNMCKISQHTQVIIRAYNNPITRRFIHNVDHVTTYSNRRNLVNIIWIKAINKAGSPVHLYQRII